MHHIFHYYSAPLLVFDVRKGSGCASGSLPSDGRENGMEEVEESSHMGHHLKHTDRSIKMPGCQKGSRETYISSSVIYETKVQIRNGKITRRILDFGVTFAIL